LTLAICLLVLAFGLALAEIAIPSFGLLSLMAAGAYVWSLVEAFNEGGSGTGWTFIGLGIVLLPIAIALGLKVLLDILTLVEHRVSHFFGRFHKALGFFSMWVVLFLSKFVILEVIDIIFGDHVELGKFLDVVVLVLSLMIVRALVDKAYRSLGVPEDEETTEPADA